MINVVEGCTRVILMLIQRHILVKGCGKASENSGDTKRESTSPDQKGATGGGDSVDSKPVMSGHV
jgi:hypothetical protein